MICLPYCRVKPRFTLTVTRTVGFQNNPTERLALVAAAPGKENARAPCLRRQERRLTSKNRWSRKTF
jgi:hypothetical protein